MKCKTILLIVGGFLLGIVGYPGSGWAGDIVPVNAACLMQASNHYGVPLSYVVGVMAAEGGHVGECRTNTNGTRDCGPMQINSIWLQSLAPYGVSESVLRDNGCVNVAIGTWILANHLSQYPPWTAIGNYHSKTSHLNQGYQQRVYKQMLKVKNVQMVIDRANSRLQKVGMR